MKSALFLIGFVTIVTQEINGSSISQELLDPESVIKTAALIYTVRINDDGKDLIPKCSGVVISKRHILTLKSCVTKVKKTSKDNTVNPEDLEDLSLAVEVGFDSTSNNQIYTISNIIKSSGELLKASATNTSMLTMTSGIAILVSEKPFSGYPNAVNATSIPVRANLAENSKVVVIGFGGNKRLWSEKPTEEPGVATVINVLSDDHCENDLNPQYEAGKTMCLQRSHLDVGCTHDLGGPVLTSDSVDSAKLVGLQYGSKRCFNGRTTSVALLLSPYRQFVRKIAKDDL